MSNPPAAATSSTTTTTTATPTISQREQTILTSFLLSQATLPHILTLPHFTKLFPPPYHTHPQAKLLYRHIQHARTQLLDRVSKTIELEVLQGTRQRSRANKASLQLLRSQGKTGPAGNSIYDDVDVGIELFGTTVNNEPVIPLKELLAQMEEAVQELAEEEKRLDEVCKGLLEEMQEAVGDLSDLRYGKFSTPGIEGKVIDQLRNLAQTCDGIIAEKDGVEEEDEDEDEDDVDMEGGSEEEHGTVS